MSRIVIGIIAGLLWGGAAALLNRAIMMKAVASNTTSAISKMSFARTGIDVVCLGAVFLVRNSEAVSFTAALVATAAMLSMLTIYFTFRIAASPDRKKEEPEAKTED